MTGNGNGEREKTVTCQHNIGYSPYRGGAIYYRCPAWWGTASSQPPTAGSAAIAPCPAASASLPAGPIYRSGHFAGIATAPLYLLKLSFCGRARDNWIVRTVFY